MCISEVSSSIEDNSRAYPSVLTPCVKSNGKLPNGIKNFLIAGFVLAYILFVPPTLCWFYSCLHFICSAYLVLVLFLLTFYLFRLPCTGFILAYILFVPPTLCWFYSCLHFLCSAYLVLVLFLLTFSLFRLPFAGFVLAYIFFVPPTFCWFCSSLHFLCSAYLVLVLF
jgi:hypothetical protein